MRRLPIEQRKRMLGELVGEPQSGLAVSSDICCKGIVSKRLGSPIPAGSKHWLKVENSAAPAVRREAEEDWGRRRTRLAATFCAYLGNLIPAGCPKLF